MAFYVGQKVVCINNSVLDPRGENLPALNVVYTIRDILVLNGGETGIRLVEIVNAPQLYMVSSGALIFDEAAFRAWRFRPVVEPKTDISIFTAMLTPKKVTEPA